jgi:hypothetical protein
MSHSYAKELASYLLERWGDTQFPELKDVFDCRLADPLPERSTLEYLISSCYQVSLLKEEQRPVRFRLILREPHCFSSEDGPPTGIHRVMFSEPLPFYENELLRLSPAVDFYRSLVGVKRDGEKGLQIWGMVHSGSRWVQNIYGGRLIAPPLPLSLVVCVTDPGRVTICKGSITIATLNRGRIASPSKEVFDSAWLPASFAWVRSKLLDLHAASRARATKPWAELDPIFVKTIAQQVVRRIISSVRNSGHGGTILIIPPEMASRVSEENPYLTIKYRVTDEETRRRFQTLIVNLMNTLAELHGHKPPSEKLVGWNEYVASNHASIVHLDEAIFSLAHLFADLTSVDGAVVFTGGLELLGFGAEISGELKRVKTVARALDVEGIRTEQVHAENFGTRHRSVFRLCNAVHKVLGVVISQDRLVRFVKWKDSMVTYWNHVATSILDF